MSTKKKPAIDLSKCAIGQRLRLRNGVKVKFKGETGNVFFPYFFNTSPNLRIEVKQNGSEWSQEKSNNDVVAIIPMPKKAAKKGNEHTMKLMSKADIRISIAQLKDVIKLLREQL